MSKNIVWFSCGASSAVVARIISRQIQDCHIVYCRVVDEHEDNLRFLTDCEKWIGRKIEVIESQKYSSVDDVIEKKKYIRGVKGSPCTRELKINVRLEYADLNDIHYWGFTNEEQVRAKNFTDRNPLMKNVYPLQIYGISKSMCLSLLNEAGIKLPIMYELGFNHNNCIGCVKSASPKYWNMIRQYFPDTFKKRAEQSRNLNFRMVVLRGEKIFLDELPENETEETDLDISCDIGCQAIYNTVLNDREHS